MNNKFKLIIGVIALVAVGGFVYAWAVDTDGGYNVFQRGTCTDQFGNHTDYCDSKYPNKLREWYPASFNGTNDTYCANTIVNCWDYNSTCLMGACQQIWNMTN